MERLDGWSRPAVLVTRKRISREAKTEPFRPPTSTNAVRQPARWAGIKSRLLTGLTVVVVVVAASVVAIALFVRPFQVRPSVTTSPTKQQPLSLETTNPTMAVGQGKPTYRGALGDFFVTGRGNEGADFPPCPRPRRPAQNYKASEVYSPVFGDAEVYECANGLILGISVYGDRPWANATSLG